MKDEVEPELKEFVYEGNWPQRPVSIFIRNAASAVTRNDIITVCKPYPGFKRVAMSDAAPERRYSRRSWVTFQYDTNIKDVCWNLSNIRVKEMELSPTVNRDVINRIRPVNGISCAPLAMQMDFNNAIELMKILDRKLKLYEADDETNGHVTEPSKDKDDDEEDDGDEHVRIITISFCKSLTSYLIPLIFKKSCFLAGRRFRGC